MDGLERIRTTVSSLLDYARQRAASPTTVDVREVVEVATRLVLPAARKKTARKKTFLTARHNRVSRAKR